MLSTALQASVTLAVALLCTGIYAHAFIAGRRPPRISSIVSLAATVLALLQLSASLYADRFGALNAYYCGIYLTIAALAPCVTALRERAPLGGQHPAAPEPASQPERPGPR
jgi:hypothetical protein